MLGLLKWRLLQGTNISHDNLNLFHFDLVFLFGSVIAVYKAAELCWATWPAATILIDSCGCQGGVLNEFCQNTALLFLLW